MAPLPGSLDEIIAVPDDLPAAAPDVPARELPAPVADVRIMVNIAGRYALASKRDPDGNRREFACRAVNISPYFFTLAGPVNGPVGERVLAHFSDFGNLQGPIVRVLSRGFVFSVTASDEERARLAAKIEWLDKNQNYEVRDEREHKRTIPQSPHSTLIFSDGRTLDCFVIDISSSGVAVSADVTPEIGDVLAVGKVVGRVVRRFAEGFAIQFVQVQDPRSLEQRIVDP